MRPCLLTLALTAALAVAGCGGQEERRPREADGDSSEATGTGKGLLSGVEGATRQSSGAEPQSSPAPAPTSAPGGVSATAPPAGGSAQRAAIMDALRPAIERELGSPVEFVVQRAGVQDGWALVVADPQRPGGGRIQPPAAFETEFRDGLTVNGILRFSGGAWTLVDHAIGPTDVWYCGVAGPPESLTGC